MSFWKRLFGSTTPEDYQPEDAAIAGRSRSKRARYRETDDADEAAGDARPRRRVTKIRRSLLELVFEAAKGAHPNEFGACMRAEGDTLTELILVPAALGGERHALLPLYNLPVDTTIVGTVHSHPSPHPIPSDADLQLFRTFGHTHIITAMPHNLHSWRAYDHDGFDVDLEIVDG